VTNEEPDWVEKKNKRNRRKEQRITTPETISTLPSPDLVVADEGNAWKTVNREAPKSTDTVDYCHSQNTHQNILSEQPAGPSSSVPALNTRIDAANRAFPRDRSLMIFHAAESQSEDAKTRYHHDLDILQRMIDRMMDSADPAVRIVRLLRLGKRTPTTSRPMKVVFEDNQIPKLLLTRLWRLKGMKIHVRADIDPEHRVLLRNAIVELRKRRDNGETDLRIVNFHIVHKKAFINRPTTLVPRPPGNQLA
jgi:hypothetical protein